MNISINNDLQPVTVGSTTKVIQPPEEKQTNFADILKASIENVNDAQLSSDQKTKALAMGEIDDLHEVMIAAQKATITLETSVQVQRKVIDAYNEIMRMQV